MNEEMAKDALLPVEFVNAVSDVAIDFSQIRVRQPAHKVLSAATGLCCARLTYSHRLCTYLSQLNLGAFLARPPPDC